MVVAELALVAAVGIGVGLAWHHSSGPRPPARAWSIEAHEKLTLAGIGAQYSSCADALSPVTTDAAVRAEIVRYLSVRLRDVAAAERDFLSEVRARRGIPESVALLATDLGLGAGRTPTGLEWVDAASIAPVPSGSPVAGSR